MRGAVAAVAAGRRADGWRSSWCQLDLSGFLPGACWMCWRCSTKFGSTC